MKKNYTSWQWSRDKIPEGMLLNARKNRKNPTEAEKVLWTYVRNRGLNGHKFRRQQPIQGYILDFYCEQARLGIEVDGWHHLSKEQKHYDEQRTKFLNQLGIEIIRFTNKMVLENTAEVLNSIGERINEKMENSPSPLPLSSGRGVSEGRGEGLKYFQFKSLLQQSGWLSPAYVGVDENGVIQYLSDLAPGHAASIEFVNGYALPGFQNAHSHAFQFAMAGMAEKHQPGTNDDFWSWREAMYECALSMNPDDMEKVATACYRKMLRNGYTHVAEFHYLHHDKDGNPYNNLAEMGERLLSAATTAGIKITLVPVFYQKGGFGIDPQPRQRRFISKTIDDYFQLLDDTAHAVTKFKNAWLGFGVHSLRAVDAKDIIKTFEQGPNYIPFHLHAAEQRKEIDDCIVHLNKRPIEWLLENLPLNDRFHIVHCTHMNDGEVKALAKSNANAVLCPGTEGNLGDGIFRLSEFYQHGGHWSIGTDSHISLNPLEDLRWLDYAQRFTTHKRNTFDDGATTLIQKTILSGRMAMGLSGAHDYFEIGHPLDAVAYSADASLLKQASAQHALQALIYTSDSSTVLGTLVNGRWVVKN